MRVTRFGMGFIYLNSWPQDFKPISHLSVTLPYISCSRSFASALFTNVVQFTQMPAGGHFAALEKPDLLADDVISFVRKTVNMKNKKNK